MIWFIVSILNERVIFMPHLFYYIAIPIVALLFLIVLIRVIKKRSSRQLHYPEGEQLYVGNLSYQMNGHHLKEFFSQYGDVQSVRLIKNSHTGRSKGFAFVTYSNAKEAKKALASNGVDVRGRAIVVRMAKPREE